MNREEFNEQSLIDRIENRINAEYRKHKAIDWAKIAAIKIAHEIMSLYGSSLPPAEGAEEILCERDDAEDFLSTKDIWNHPRISDRTDNESYEVADLMAEFAQSFATLHAQRIADKMVSEKLSEEYKRGIEDGKIIGKHGSVSYIE